MDERADKTDGEFSLEQGCLAKNDLGVEVDLRDFDILVYRDNDREVTFGRQDGLLAGVLYSNTVLFQPGKTWDPPHHTTAITEAERAAIKNNICAAMRLWDSQIFFKDDFGVPSRFIYPGHVHTEENS